MSIRTTSEDDALISMVGFLITTSAKHLGVRLGDELSRHGLTIPQWSVLNTLWQEDGLSQRELSRRTHIDQATLAEMLRRMTAAGRVRRERDPADNRLQRVYAAPDPALRTATLEAATRVNEVALNGFSEADRKRLSALLTRALANLEDVS